MKRLLKRLTNLNKLSCAMNIAFGLSLLGITLFFQFGRTIITTPEAIVYLGHGYITETRLWVRIVEGIISLGLITLGINRLLYYRKCKKGVLDA